MTEIKVGNRYIPDNWNDCGNAPAGSAWIVVTGTDDDDDLVYDLYDRFGNRIGNCGACFSQSNLKPYPVTLETVVVGDTLTDGYDDCAVMAACGKLLGLSENNKPDEFDKWYAIDELKESGWKVKNEDEEVVEMTVADVEKLAGKKVKIVKE